MANIIIDGFDTLGASTNIHSTDYEAYSDPSYSEESLLFRSLNNTEHTMGIRFLPRDMEGKVYVPEKGKRIYYRVRLWFEDRASKWYDISNVDCEDTEVGIIHISNLIGDLGIVEN